MTNILLVLQLIFAVCLTASILLQARGSGLSNIFGGSGETYRSIRGMEKILFWATIVFAAGFLLTSILNIMI